MNLIAPLIRLAERLPLSDRMTLSGIDFLVGKTARQLALAKEGADAAFVRGMSQFPIAVHTDDANQQHYELPPAFFSLMLGERRKYSCCLYPEEQGIAINDADSLRTENVTSALDTAERTALAATCAHAGLVDGQDILELGCGWGSLTLWMAEQYPNASITAVSNSAPQRAYIEKMLAAGGHRHVRIVTADMNDFIPSGMAGFDRVVSVEMFEHMANWTQLLTRVREWLRPDGRLFVHVFSHRDAPYRFDHKDPADWIAQHFFTGGLMPSHRMMEQFGDLFTIEDQWRWNGSHYAETARDWLRNFDRHEKDIDRILADVYGADARLWNRRWRLFLLSTIGLFGHDRGTQWGVSHYLLKPFPRVGRII